MKIPSGTPRVSCTFQTVRQQQVPVLADRLSRVRVAADLSEAGQEPLALWLCHPLLSHVSLLCLCQLQPLYERLDLYSAPHWLLVVHLYEYLGFSQYLTPIKDKVKLKLLISTFQEKSNIFNFSMIFKMVAVFVKWSRIIFWDLVGMLFRAVKFPTTFMLNVLLNLLPFSQKVDAWFQESAFPL